MITLKDILRDKEREVRERKAREPLSLLKDKISQAPPLRNFKKALQGKGLKAIAEIKEKSPSTGLIATRVDITKIAREYEASKHCCAISVLTDKKYFGGDIQWLKKVKDETTKPILRKDFIIDEYQIYESRLYGADAILLIATILSRDNLRRFFDIARDLGLACLIESHYREDLAKIPAGAPIYGINNRDLSGDFSIDVEVTRRLIKYIPRGKIIIAESGLVTREDINFIKSLRRVKAVLIGTSIIKTPHPRKTLDKLIS